jgi:hypothetical protein
VSNNLKLRSICEDTFTASYRSSFKIKSALWCNLIAIIYWMIRNKHYVPHCIYDSFRHSWINLKIEKKKMNEQFRQFCVRRRACVCIHDRCGRMPMKWIRDMKMNNIRLFSYSFNFWQSFDFLLKPFSNVVCFSDQHRFGQDDMNFNKKRGTKVKCTNSLYLFDKRRMMIG